jgi:hypothetical protein
MGISVLLDAFWSKVTQLSVNPATLNAALLDLRADTSLESDLKAWPAGDVRSRDYLTVRVTVFFDILFSGIAAFCVDPATLDAAFLDLLANASLKSDRRAWSARDVRSRDIRTVGVSIFLDALFGGTTTLGVDPATPDAAFLDLLLFASLLADLWALLEGIWGASPTLDLLRARRLDAVLQDALTESIGIRGIDSAILIRSTCLNQFP